MQQIRTVGKVKVTRDYPAGSGVSSEDNNGQSVYKWHVTFISNLEVFSGDNDADWPAAPYHSRAWGINVGSQNKKMICDSSRLKDAAAGLSTVSCTTAIERDGTDPVNGFFQLCLDTSSSGSGRSNTGSSYVSTSACTRNIRHDAPAMRSDAPQNPESSVEAALEALPQVSDVSVTRNRTTAAPNFSGDYTWTVTFLRDGLSDACLQGTPPSCPASGNLPLLTFGPPSGVQLIKPLSGILNPMAFQELVPGNVLYGLFGLSFTVNPLSPEVTSIATYQTLPARSIPFDASPAELEQALLSMLPVKGVITTVALTA